MGAILQTLGLGGPQRPQTGVTPPMTTPPIAGAEDNSPVENVLVQGDAWHPKKPTFLGALADGYLVANGMKPAFAVERDRQNLQGALHGYQSDPEAAIRRLMSIPGHEQDGLNLYNQYVDNKRADDAAAALREERADKARARIGGYLAAINSSKDPAGAYTKLLPTLRNMAKARGLDPNELPDNYDSDIMSTFALGSLTVDQQHDNDSQDSYRERRLDQMDQTIENRDRYQQARLEQMDDRQTETERHNREMEEKGGTDSKREMADRIIQTKYGPGQIFNKGLNLSVHAPNGQYAIYQNVGPNKWKFVGYKPPSKK